MWWWVESHDAAVLLTPSDCVGVLTLVWHRYHICGLGCIFSFLPQTGKRLEVNHVVVHQYLPYSVCHTGILVIAGERRAVLEWPFFFRAQRKELPGSFFALWAFSEIHIVSFLAWAELLLGIYQLPLWVELDVLRLADIVLNVMESICQRYFCFNPYGYRSLSILAPILEFVMNKREN